MGLGVATDIRDVAIQIKFGVDRIGNEALPAIQTAIERTNRILDERL